MVEKATLIQIKFLLDLGLITSEEAKSISKKQAQQILRVEVPKFHARKLEEWGIKTKLELDLMLPWELKLLYNSSVRIRKVNILITELKKYVIGDLVWCRILNADGKETKIPASITAIRYPQAQGGGFRQLSFNITVQFDNGKRRAVNVKSIIKREK